MAGHNWELVRDLGLAQLAGNAAEVQRLSLEVQAGQLACTHITNPDPNAKPDLPLVNAGLTTLGRRCYKCGVGLEVKSAPADVKPGLVKSRTAPVEIKRAQGA